MVVCAFKFLDLLPNQRQFVADKKDKEVPIPSDVTKERTKTLNLQSGINEANIQTAMFTHCLLV